MKNKSKIYTESRNICSMDLIRIDWKHAIKEAEDAIERNKNSQSFETVLKSYRLLCEIQRMYRSDDINGYLELLDENRDFLKG